MLLLPAWSRYATALEQRAVLERAPVGPRIPAPCRPPRGPTPRIRRSRTRCGGGDNSIDIRETVRATRPRCTCRPSVIASSSEHFRSRPANPCTARSTTSHVRELRRQAGGIAHAPQVRPERWPGESGGRDTDRHHRGRVGTAGVSGEGGGSAPLGPRPDVGPAVDEPEYWGGRESSHEVQS